jgi:hypothetical protein
MNFQPARDALAAADADAGEVCAALVAALHPRDPELQRLGEMVQFALFGGAMPPGLKPSTHVFLDNIDRIRRHGTAGPSTGRRFLPRDLDFIADLGGATAWSLAQSLNHLVMTALEPTRRAAVVGTMRDDGIYILEWVAHYQAIGFEHLFVYTNDNADGSLDLLSLLARHGVLTLLESEITGAVPPEAKAFGHAVHLLPELRDFAWAAFVDSDEFLVPAPRFDYSILHALEALGRADPDGRIGAILYDWLWFVSDMVFERQPGLLLERFQHARPHWLAKCLVRMRDVLSMRHQHYPELSPGMTVVDSAFEPVDLATIWERREAQYAGGRINHYWPRSFQEFAIKKARGASLAIAENLYDRPYETFFTWNGRPSPENSFAPDPRLLQAVRQRIDCLRRLDGVAAAADRIDRDFALVLARVGDEARLRQDYADNRAEPGSL